MTFSNRIQNGIRWRDLTYCISASEDQKMETLRG
jgi:hypothetical protein